MSVDDVRRARAFLLHAAEPPAAELALFVAQVGPVEAAHQIDAGKAPGPVLDECRGGDHWASADASLRTAAETGIRLITPEDDEWPAVHFAALTTAAQDTASLTAPLGLWVHGPGRLDELFARSVTVIGARAATEYGEHHAAEFGYGLASRAVCVFSGAAYGIDGSAHRGALSAGGETVAVLGCGINAGYPAGHVGLLTRIATSGLVVSEYPPSVPPARHRFLTRNRILGAAEATLVVEAGRRSGALNTAGVARVLGRPVAAMPGPVSSALSMGCHGLIQQRRAVLVTCVDDLLTQISAQPESAAN